MASKRFLRVAASLFSVALLPVFGETSQPVPLPDAPTPSAFLSTPQQTSLPERGQPVPPGVPVHRSDTQTYRVSKWYGVIDPGIEVPKLSTHDKLMFWAHESITPTGWFPIAFSA